MVSFVTGVATVPMLLERKGGSGDSIEYQHPCHPTNWKVMLGWAATIALIIGAGLLPFSLGLIIAMPLVSYASWHAYRDG